MSVTSITSNKNCFSSKIEEKVKLVNTGLLSLALNVFHFVGYHFAAKTGCFDSIYHLDAKNKSAEKGLNAFYKLIGSERRIINMPSDTKILVPTKNILQSELTTENGMKEIADTVQMLLSNAGYECLFQKKNLLNGVCRGMVQIFISDYLRLRTLDLPFEEAAIKAAEPFKEGATLLACAMQHIHHVYETNDEPANKDVYDQIIHRTKTHYFGYQLLKTKTAIPEIMNFSTSKEFASLKDGAYDISIGWSILKKDGEQSIEKKDGHAMALLVEDGSFLILDPSENLFKHPDPDRYFKVLRIHGNGVIICTSIYLESENVSILRYEDR